MAFCKNCGQQLNDGAEFCTNCGTPVENTQQPQQAPVQPQVMNNGEPLPSEKGLAWLAYILWAPAFLIPLFVRKTSDYCKFHVKEGVTLWAAHIAYWLVTTITLTIIDLPTRVYYYGLWIHSGVYHVFNIIFGLGNIFFAVMMIIGIVNAATGKMNELPLIGKIPFVKTLMDKIYAGLNK